MPQDWIKVMNTGGVPIIALGQAFYPGETMVMPPSEVDRLRQQYGKLTVTVVTPLAVGEPVPLTGVRFIIDELSPSEPFTIGEEPAPKQSKAHK